MHRPFQNDQNKWLSSRQIKAQVHSEWLAKWLQATANKVKFHFGRQSRKIANYITWKL